MIEYDASEQTEIPEANGFSVKIIGVGGSGANVLDRMALEGIEAGDLLTVNTDVRALSTSVSNNKIQLGKELLMGMGAGGDPELGREAALEAENEIRDAVRGYSMVFVCVGLGGGTGSGAAPEVCRIAREEGAFLVAFTALPFKFEGKRRMQQATNALAGIGEYANAVVTFENDRMGELIVAKEGIQQAFAAADKLISQSILATTNMVTQPGIIRLGMDDLLTALRNRDSRCLFGFGQAKGDNRAKLALGKALKSPLIDKNYLHDSAENVLIHISGGESLTLYEVEMLMEELAKNVSDNAQILFGVGMEKKLGNSLAVTLISSVSSEKIGRKEEGEGQEDKKKALSEQEDSGDDDGDDDGSGGGAGSDEEGESEGQADVLEGAEESSRPPPDDQKNQEGELWQEAGAQSESAIFPPADEDEPEWAPIKEGQIQDDQEAEISSAAATEAADEISADDEQEESDEAVEEEARLKAEEEERKKKEEEEAKAKAEEEERKKKEEEEAKAKAEEEERKKKEEEKAKAKAEEEKRKKKEEEEAKAKAEEEERKKKEEEEAKAKAEEEERKKKEEEEAKAKAEEEERKKKEEEEAKAKAEEEKRKKKEEEEAKAKAEEEERKKKEEEEAKAKAEEEERKKKEEEEAKAKAEEEERKKKEEEEAKAKAEEEAEEEDTTADSNQGMASLLGLKPVEESEDNLSDLQPVDEFASEEPGAKEVEDSEPSPFEIVEDEEEEEIHAEAEEDSLQDEDEDSTATKEPEQTSGESSAPMSIRELAKKSLQAKQEQDDEDELIVHELEEPEEDSELEDESTIVPLSFDDSEETSSDTEETGEKKSLDEVILSAASGVSEGQEITLSRIDSSEEEGDAEESARAGGEPEADSDSVAEETAEQEEEEKSDASADGKSPQSQGVLELEPLAKGRFAKTDPTIVDGQDLDVPTFLRARRD